MSRKKKQYYSFENDEDINPMNFVSNLSDVMLILAVGIMLALIMHWNVPINTLNEDQAEEIQNGDKQDQAVEFSEDDLQGISDLPENLQKTGEVYYDPVTGSYYIVNDTDND